MATEFYVRPIGRPDPLAYSDPTASESSGLGRMAGVLVVRGGQIVGVVSRKQNGAGDTPGGARDDARPSV